MYAWIWSKLPGPWPVKLVEALVAFAAVETRVLELILSGAPVPETLSALLRALEAGLAGGGLRDTRVAVADARDVVVGVQVAPAVDVGHPDQRPDRRPVRRLLA